MSTLQNYCRSWYKENALQGSCWFWCDKTNTDQHWWWCSICV